MALADNEFDITRYGIDGEREFFSWEIPVALKEECVYGGCSYTDLETGQEISEEDIAGGNYLIAAEGWKGVHFSFDPDSQCTVLSFMEADDGELVEYAREYVLPDKKMAREDLYSGACFVLASPGESFLGTDFPELLNINVNAPALYVSMTFGGECDADSIGDIISFLKMMCSADRSGDIPEYDKKRHPEGVSGIRGQISGDDGGAWFVVYFSYNGEWYADTAWYFPKGGDTVRMCENVTFGYKYDMSFEIGSYDRQEVEGTVLEWYLGAVEGFSAMDRGKALSALVRDGKLEQLMKAPVLKPLFLHAFSETWGINSESISDMFRFTGGRADGRNVYKSLCVGREQLRVMMKHFSNYSWDRTYALTSSFGFFNFPAILIWEDTMLRQRAKIRDKVDIYRKVSPSLLDQIYSFITEVASATSPHGLLKRQEVFNCMAEFVSMSSLSALLKSGWFFKIVMGSGKSDSAAIYTDYMGMLRRMSMGDQPLTFSSFKELEEAHDEITYIYNVTTTKIHEEERANFISACRKAMAYAWSEGGFCIAVPEKPEDLVKEGTVLHHCVKSYIETVADGKSMIFFLRDVQEPDRPFFTVEVSWDGSGDKYVRQVHGMCNCNIDTVPEAEAFFKKWCAEFRFRADDYDECL